MSQFSCLLSLDQGERLHHTDAGFSATGHEVRWPIKNNFMVLTDMLHRMYVDVLVLARTKPVCQTQRR